MNIDSKLVTPAARNGMSSVTDGRNHIPLRGWSERIVSLHMVALGVRTTPVSPP
jgi:hypothetical protein